SGGTGDRRGKRGRISRCYRPVRLPGSAASASPPRSGRHSRRNGRGRWGPCAGCWRWSCSRVLLSWATEGTFRALLRADRPTGKALVGKRGTNEPHAPKAAEVVAIPEKAGARTKSKPARQSMG